MIIYVANNSEKIFLNRLFRWSGAAYVGSFIESNDYTAYRPVDHRGRAANTMPLTLRERAPLFARQYDRFLTTGRWFDSIVHKADVIPLPLPG